MKTTISKFMTSCVGAVSVLLMTSTVSAAAPQALPQQLGATLSRNDANYAQLRTAILAEGWTPVINPECQSNVYGGSRENPIEPSNPSENVCLLLPEVKGCSGDGYCIMFFSHPQQSGFLSVGTYGDYGAPETMNVRFYQIGTSDGTND